MTQETKNDKETTEEVIVKEQCTLQNSNSETVSSDETTKEVEETKENAVVEQSTDNDNNETTKKSSDSKKETKETSAEVDKKESGDKTASSDNDSDDESNDAQEPNITKDEFKVLKKEVKDIGARKEWLFEVRSIISKEIKSLFMNLKDLKESRDVLTKKVRTLKDDREKINVEIKGAITKIQGTGNFNKDDKRINVGKLKKELDKLQYHIETTPLSPEEEKKIMKIIKDKEKQISKAKDVYEVKTENVEISKEINGLKDKSNHIHDDVQESAKESQLKHETMISVSKEIKFLKAKEKEIHQLFSDIKDVYKTKRKLLMRNRKFFSQPKKKSNKITNKKEIIKKVEENFEAKLKAGKKITTEDLLNFSK